jgi:hypothetical protein
MFFLSSAKDPGLDIYGINVYTLAMDYTAIIRNILEHLSRVPLLKLYEIKPVQLSGGVSWRFLSHQDESGVLHRWDFVDFIPEDPTADLHSWEVFGDIAAANVPMMLHYVSIGRRSGAHQNSPWCRTFSHPTVANTFRFNKNSGDSLKESWKPVYFSGNPKNTASKWVDLMEADNAIAPLIKHIHVKEISDENRGNFLTDVLQEASSMKEITSSVSPRLIPMGRYACDHPYACPHQAFCYSSETLDNVGVYKRVHQPASEAVEV